MKAIKDFISSHMLPIAAFVLMLISFAVTPPTGEMIVSLRWDGIAMAAVMTMTIAGLKKEKAVNGIRRSAAVFTHLGSTAAFFAVITLLLSPFITSPFAVCSILPIAMDILKRKERQEMIPSFAALITLSAIAGGTILPGGSWHSMVLHKALGNESFLTTMLPYFIASLPVLALSIPILLGTRIMERTYIPEGNEEAGGNKGMRMLYVCFAFITFLSSLSLFRWFDILIFSAAILIVFDREVFRKADYSMLLSMIFLLIAGKGFMPVTAALMADGLVWKTIITAELFGGLPVASFLTALDTDQVLLLQAVNIGSAGTMLSLPALAACGIVGKEYRKGFIARYTIISVILLAVFVAVLLIIA